MKIGTNIKKLRTAQGLTQDQLAEKLYVTRQTVSSWERSASNPNLEQLEAISAALEIDVMTLLYGPQKNYRPSREQILRAVGLALLVLVMWAACWRLGHWSERMLKEYGDVFPHFLYYYYQVLTAALAGVALIALARLRWKLPLEGRGRRICLGVGLALLAVVLSYGPLAGLSMAWGNLLPPWVNQAIGTILWSLWKGMFKALTVLAGGLLCLVRKPREKGTQQEERDQT